MKKTAQSLGYSIIGLKHAIVTETNLRRFVLGHILIMLVSLWLRIDILLLIFLCMVAGFFLIIELLNTAIERLADTVDDCEKTHRGGHYHPGIKLTKDVSAAASLIAFLLYVVMVLLIFIP